MNAVNVNDTVYVACKHQAGRHPERCRIGVCRGTPALEDGWSLFSTMKGESTDGVYAAVMQSLNDIKATNYDAVNEAWMIPAVVLDKWMTSSAEILQHRNSAQGQEDFMTVNEANLRHILGEQVGYCVMTAHRASRNGTLNERNVQNHSSMELLANALKANALVHVPVLGGHLGAFNGKSGEVTWGMVEETAFIVPCRSSDGFVLPLDMLKHICVNLGRVYGRNEILVVSPDGHAQFVVTDSDPRDGLSLGDVARTADNVPLNELLLQYFAAFSKTNEGCPERQLRFKAGFRSYAEGHMRYLSGEICRAYGARGC